MYNFEAIKLLEIYKEDRAFVNEGEFASYLKNIANCYYLLTNSYNNADGSDEIDYVESCLIISTLVYKLSGDYYSFNQAFEAYYYGAIPAHKLAIYTKTDTSFEQNLYLSSIAMYNKAYEYGENQSDIRSAKVFAKNGLEKSVV